MKLRPLIGVLITTGMICQSAHASVFSSMVNFLRTIAAAQAGINTSELDIDEQMKQMNAHLTSHSGWGNYNSHDYQTYGGDAGKWSAVMKMASQGKGDGQLGDSISGLNNQFLIKGEDYKQSESIKSNKEYFEAESGTALSVRAASNLDYDKVEEEINYQKMLQQQIERTNDLKASVDLSSRIQVEGNLINLQVLRESAMANQQKSISEQGALMSTVANARFLTKEKR